MAMSRRSGRTSGGLDPQDGTRDYDREKEERRGRRSSRGSRDDGEDRPERGGSRRGRDQDDEPRGSRRGRSRDDSGDDGDRGERGGRSRGRDDGDGPRGRSRSSRSSGRDDDRGTSRRSSGGRATGGFGAYSAKRQATGGGNYADEFKPEDGKPTLIKILDAEPFDVYLQHWVEEGKARGKTRHSFVCLDDDYFGDEDDRDSCPLCEIGEPASTMSLFNVIDLSNPRKPEVKVWRTSVTISDILERMSGEEKTSPLNREDLYFEVLMTKKSRKTSYSIVPVKERDLYEDYKVDPLTDEEITEFEADCFDDRTAVTTVDSWEDLDELAASLDD